MRANTWIMRGRPRPLSLAGPNVRGARNSCGSIADLSQFSACGRNNAKRPFSRQRSNKSKLPSEGAYLMLSTVEPNRIDPPLGAIRGPRIESILQRLGRAYTPRVTQSTCGMG